MSEFKRIFLHGVLLAVLGSLAACATGTGAGAEATSADEPKATPYSVADDVKLENRIRQAIYKDGLLAGDRVEVDVQQGVATVTGRVSNRMHATRVERILEGIDELRGFNLELVETGGRF